jgi:hypothetical protein
MPIPSFDTTYVSPVATHAMIPERLLVARGDDRFFLWFGDRRPPALEEISTELAYWVLAQPVIQPVTHAVWLHVDDLPTISLPTSGDRP